MKCPKCNTDNPDTLKFCGECGTQLPSIEEIEVTETLETPMEELTRGTTFAGRYEIIEGLGKGGMGRVYRVEDIKTKEEIALKLIKPEFASDKKTIERFRNELTSARKITHKNVCRMYDLGEEKGLHFITMEYISGQDLKGLIRQTGQLTLGKTISIAKQICDGLAEAHSLGVIHRDLKPNNIMIDRGGNAKIMDFGIARAVKGKSITGSGVMIGTPQYMSPEQVEGKEVDQRSDIYSLGIIIYEMLTDRVPFDGDTPLTVGVKQKTESPKEPKDFNPQIPDDFNRVILKCLEKDKENRFQNAGEVKSELEKIEQGLPTTDRDIPRKKTLTSREITVQFSMKKIFIPAFAVIALAVIGFIIWKPWAGGTVAPVSSDKPSLAVLFFRNGSGDQSNDHWRETLCDYIITDISQSKYINVFDFTQIVGVLEKHNLLGLNRYSDENLSSVSSTLGASHILTGSFSTPGGSFRIDYSLYDFKKREVIASDRVEGEGEESIPSMVDELTRKIKPNFNLTAAQISADRDKEVGVITTNSPEAYRYYREGRALFKTRDWDASIPLFERAIEIDPDFAMAYRSLASAYYNMGGGQDKVKEYLSKALEKSDRLTYKEKKIIEAQCSASIDHDYNKALAISKELLKDYPENNLINHQIALYYTNLLDYDNAIRHYEIARKNRTELLGTYDSLASNFMAKGEYEKAREALRDYIEYVSDNAIIRRQLALTYILDGRMEEASAEARKAIELNPRMFMMGIFDHIKGNFEAAEKEYEKWLDENLKIAANYWLTLLNLAQGKYEKALSFIQVGLVLAEEGKIQYFMLNFHALMGFCDFALEKYKEALAEAQTLWEKAIEQEDLNFQIRSLIIQSLVFYKTQQPEKIREAASLVEKQLEAFNLADTPYTREILIFDGLADLAQNKLESAVKILKRAWESRDYEREWIEDHILYLYYLGEAQLMAGDLEAARQSYERGLSLTTGKLYFGDLWARSYFRLGEIYEKLGNRSKAIENTEKFLEMWKDADPGIAEVEDAKEALKRLKKD